MVIYADVLVTLNIFVTYFIILATGKIASVFAKTKRIVFASFLGGVTSLYIFLPQQPFILEIAVKLAFAALISLVAFGYKTAKKYIRCVLSFFAVSFIYAGFMIGFWYVLKPAGMAINNGVVYFSISPIILIISAGCCYFLITAAMHFYAREDVNAKLAEVTVFRGGSEFLFRCMVDTGNTVTDPLGGSKIIILGKRAGEEIFGEDSEKILRIEPMIMTEYKARVIPYKTALGEGIMPIVTVDSATAEGIKTDSVSVGILNINLGDFDAIISPSFFD